MDIGESTQYLEGTYTQAATRSNNKSPSFSVSDPRSPLPQVLRLIGGMSHRLLRVPAVLHRQDQLGVHQLLQHLAVQWTPAQEETPTLCCVRPVSEWPPRPPTPRPPAAARIRCALLTDLFLLFHLLFRLRCLC